MMMHQRNLPLQRQDEDGRNWPKSQLDDKAFTGKSPLTAKHYLLLSIVLLAVSILIFRAHINIVCDNAVPPLQKLEVDELNGLEFMKGRKVVLVSHELSLTGGPLLLMELAVLLSNVGVYTQWVTNHRESEINTVSRNLESKLRSKGIKIFSARGPQTVKMVHDADLVILNTAVAGKWFDLVFKEDVAEVLPKTLWWIHEMRGHYFTLDLVKHLPYVGGVMIDSHATAEYWKNRTKERLRLSMPPTYVVHLGNSRELTEAANNELARRLLREHVREVLGVGHNDVLFAIVNSVSRGKGQDLFLKSFYEAVQLVKQNSKRQIEGLHAVVVGSDMSAQKYEIELREFVREMEIDHLVHFVNKTMNVIPYLAAMDVLVQNSQARGECFGRITIEAMAFQLPVLGTAAGGTMEIVVNGSTGILHPVGRQGVSVLARNIINLYYHKEYRLEMGRNGCARVRENFMEKHMALRIGHVLQEVLSRAKQHEHSI